MVAQFSQRFGQLVQQLRWKRLGLDQSAHLAAAVLGENLGEVELIREGAVGLHRDDEPRRHRKSRRREPAQNSRLSANCLNAGRIGADGLSTSGLRPGGLGAGRLFPAGLGVDRLSADCLGTSSPNAGCFVASRLGVSGPGGLGTGGSGAGRPGVGGFGEVDEQLLVLRARASTEC